MAKVLLVEDEPLILSEVASWLEFEGYDVLTAEDGQQGLAMAIQYRPDLIVSDIRMPNMNGHELLIAIRNNRAIQHIPLIFATASAEKSSIKEGMSLGANAYVTKPFRFAELMDAVHEFANK